MSLLFNCQSLCKSYGTRLLFEGLSLSIFSSDRIGLIGPNGSGKSTLMKIIAGVDNADEGTLAPKKGLRVGYVPQSCDFPDLPVEKILLDALRDDHEKADYEKELLVEIWLSKLGFKGNEPSAKNLSGGWKKRLSLAQQLILSPDLLLLDEPTNHLDLEGILWLEKFLIKEVPTYLLVSHDRYFLQHMVNRVIEIDRVYPDGMFAIDGTYANFLEKKEAFLLGQLQQERSIASKARRETEWLRQSPKARTVKSRSRVDDAYEIIDELADVKSRNRQSRVGIDFTASERQTNKLIAAKNLSKQINQRTLFKHLDFTLSPGTRMGLMGPNGSGKTTLLRLLANEIAPDQGTLKFADNLQIVYFDQHRLLLSDEMTLRQALSPTEDFVRFRGQMIHVNGWCKRFLFSPNILDIPLKNLSGGERARISIAHLMLQPADILLLDEPTNDLDIPTLETLEESLIEFPGAVVLITHDRCMLDRICNVFLALGDPESNALYADYAQWESAVAALAAPVEQKPKEKKQESSAPKAKLTYMEKREYEQMEELILKKETEVQELNHLLLDPQIANDGQKLHEICTKVSVEETQIEQLYLRWEELERKLRGE